MTTIQTTEPTLSAERTVPSPNTIASHAGGYDGASPSGRYTAVIDVGSGSARAVVMQVNPGGGVEIVAQQRVTST